MCNKLVAQIAQSVFITHLEAVMTYAAARNFDAAHESLTQAEIARAGIPRVTSDVGSIDFDDMLDNARKALEAAERRVYRGSAVRQAAFRRKARSS